MSYSSELISKVVFLWIFSLCMGYAQIIDIPDPNFKHILVNTDCVDSDNNGIFDRDADLNNDGEIQLSEAQSVIWHLRVAPNNVASLEGIQYFTNLKRLSCVDNLLTEINVADLQDLERLHVGFNNLGSLDVTQNANLKILYCYRNNLSSLDVTQNDQLEELSAGYNNLSEIDLSMNEGLTLIHLQHNSLTQIDVSQNPNLDWLRLDYNQLVYINVSQNPNLTSFWCRNNQLQALRIDNGNNTSLDSFTAIFNEELYCIQVDDVQYANSRICNSASNFTWCKDGDADYSENCFFSTNDFDLESISLYPNPSGNFLTISANEQIDLVEIFTVSGKWMLTSASPNIDVSGLPAGLYFAIVHLSGNKTTAKFIKN